MADDTTNVRPDNITIEEPASVICTQS
jgi:hypothetical protein